VHKKSLHVESLLRKLGCLRNMSHYPLPYRFETTSTPSSPGGQGQPRKTLALAAPANISNARKDTIAAMDQDVAKVLKQRLNEAKGNLADQAGSNSPSQAGRASIFASSPTFFLSRKSTREGSSIARIVDELAGKSSATVTERIASKRRSVDLNQRRQEEQQSQETEVTRKKVRKHWMFARAAVKVLMLHFSDLRRKDHMKTVKVVINAFIEFRRVKSHIRHINKAVKTFTSLCRTFLITKKRRCDQMQKDWQRIEDHHLSSYFRLYAQKIMTEQKGKSNSETMSPKREGKKSRKGGPVSPDGKQKQELLSLLESNGLEDGFDWKQYRIPARDRRAVISRYYMISLRKRVRTENNFMTAVKKAVDDEKELMSFLRLFGASYSQAKSVGAVPVHVETSAPPSYSSLGEEAALQLIALSAQALCGVEPYQEHPANKDLPKPSQPRPERGGQDGHGVPPSPVSTAAMATAPLLRMDRQISLGRFARGSNKSGRTARSLSEEQLSGEDQSNKGEEPAYVDLEEVFRRFTPRLREISEEQVMEYRSASQG